MTDTASEQYRAECEARVVMRMPRELRRDFYAMVLDHRGYQAAKNLVEDVNRMWRERQMGHEDDEMIGEGEKT